MYDNTSFIMGSLEFNGNAINSSDIGIDIDEYLFRECAYEMYNDSSFVMGSITFNDNFITSGSAAATASISMIGMTSGVICTAMHRLSWTMWSSAEMTSTPAATA